MPVEFTLSGTNMGKIMAVSGLESLKTDRIYRVATTYTGVNDGPIDAKPIVLIEYDSKKFNLGKYKKDLNLFFKRNGIELTWKDINWSESVWITLRKDLRRDIGLSAAVVQNIVLFMENKIKLKKTMIPGLPYSWNNIGINEMEQLHGEQKVETLLTSSDF